MASTVEFSHTLFGSCRGRFSRLTHPFPRADYGFEYDSDAEQEEEDVDIENQYYNAKGGCFSVSPPPWTRLSASAPHERSDSRQTVHAPLRDGHRSARERRPQGRP